MTRRKQIAILPKRCVGGICRKKFTVLSVERRQNKPQRISLPSWSNIVSDIRSCFARKPRKEHKKRVVYGIDRQEYIMIAVQWKKKPRKRPDRLKTLGARGKMLGKACIRAVRGHRSGLQTAGIAVLTVTMVAQGGWIWSRMLDAGSTPKNSIARSIVRRLNERNIRSDTIEPAAYPIKMAVRNEEGLYGIQYSVVGMTDVYSQTEALWSTALGQCSALRLTTQNEYAAALKNHMVFMEFEGSIPLKLLAGWLDTEVPNGGNDRSCSALLISRGNPGGYHIYLRDAETGTFLTAQTVLSDAEFDSVINLFRPNGCQMAAEANTVISPDTLHFPQQQGFDTITIRPYEGGIDTVMQSFYMDGSSAQQSAYTTQSGTMLYSDDTATLRITSDKMLSYDSDSGIRAFRGSLRSGDAIQAYAQLGKTISTTLLENINSSGEAQLIKAYTDDDGRYVTVFALRIDGVPLDNDVGYFARYEFEDGAMVHADAVLRVCAITGNVATIMPESVAASVRKDATAQLSLRYTDTAPLKESSKSTMRSSGSRNLLGGTQTADDSWVEQAEVNQSGTWLDSSPQQGQQNTEEGQFEEQTEDPLLNDQIEITNESELQNQSVVNGTADTSEVGQVVSATATWKFLLYHASQADDIVLPEPGQLPDIVCQMPDLLQPLGAKGGAAQ